MKRSISLWRTSALAVALATAGACADGGTGPVRAASLVPVTATTQTALVASPVPVPPAVRVSDERGRGLPGVKVTFAVTEGSGTVAASAVTDAGGVAVAADWVLGTEAQENALTAAVRGLEPVVFRATAGPGEAVAMQREGPALRSSQAGTVQGDSILVRVVDRHRNGVSGVEVSFSASHGTLSSERVTTGAQGWAGVYLPLPTQAGTIRVQASAQGFEPIQYDVRVTPGPPANFVGGARDSLQVPQTGYTGRVGQPFPYYYIWQITLIDAFGNRVPGYPVTFMPQPGNGVVEGGGAVVTGSLGVARVNWAPGQPGVNRMKVTALGLDPVWLFMSARPACGSVPYTLYSTITDYVNESTACGNRGELYSVVVPVAQCVEFRIQVAYGPYNGDLALTDLDNRPVAGASYRTYRVGTFGETNKLVRVRLSAGTYRLSASAIYWWVEYPASVQIRYSSWTLSSRPVYPDEDAQCAFPT